MSQAEIGERIKRKCGENWPPITQARLARRLDIDSTAFNRILAGTRKAPDGMYERIAEILGCPLDEIMSSPEAAA